MNPTQNKRLHALLNILGYDAEYKKALVWSYSDRRSESSKDLRSEEAQRLIDYLQLQVNRQASREAKNARMLAKIRALGAVCCGYTPQQQPDWSRVVIPYLVKVAKVGSWHKVAQASTKQLQSLIYQLEKIRDWKERQQGAQAVEQLVEGLPGIVLSAINPESND